MRPVADLPVRSIPWRGVAAFALDNVVPLLGLTALVIGAFQVPGAWGPVIGWAVAGAALIYTHTQIKDEIEALKARARADAIDRDRHRIELRRMKAVA